MELQHRRRAAPRRPRAGIEISDDAVRVVEVSGGNSTVATKMAEIPLRPGVVRDGEIIDEAAAAATIREGWRPAGLRTRSVVAGLGIHSTVERIVELPQLRPRDLRSALTFELADVLPFPVDEAIIDTITLDRVHDESGRQTVRHLCIAAHRPPVIELVRTLNAAGLRVLALDVLGLAALRVVRCADQRPGNGAIVAVGHGTLSVVVHRNGRPLFVRGIVVSNASMGVSGALAQELSMIDSLRGGPQPTSSGADGGDQLTEAVLATLAYHETLEPEVAIERLEVLGRADRAPQIARDLACATDVDVSLLSIDGVPRLELVGSALPTETERHGDHAVALGLAIASRHEAAGTAWPRLSPGKAGDATSRRARVAICSAAAGVALSGCALLLTQGSAPAVAEAGAARAQLSQVNAELADLGDAVTGARESAVLERLAADAGQTAVPWAELTDVLRGSAPADSTVLAIDGVGPSNGEPGSVTLTIETSSGADVESWLTVMSAVESLRDPWLVEIAEGGEGSTVFTVEAQIATTSAAPDDDTAEVGR
ncbi:MAG: pilus assembly protein PilM [Microthrixaceae bacterium]